MIKFQTSSAAQLRKPNRKRRRHAAICTFLLLGSLKACHRSGLKSGCSKNNNNKNKNQTVNFLCIKQFYYITMGKYTGPSSVAINSQHRVLVCTRSHKPNKRKQRKRNLYLLNACYTSAEKRNIFTGLWHRTLPALSSPSSTLAHPAPPVSKWGKSVCLCGRDPNVAGVVPLPHPHSFKKQT